MLRFFILFLISFSAHADSPVIIESDQAEFSNDKGNVKYTGHVVMTQDDSMLKADTLTISKDTNNQIDLFIAIGKPAKFDTKDKESLIQASAKTIKYYPKTAVLELIGEAEIISNDDLIKGDKLNYNTKTKNLDSGNSKKRTTMIISPNSENLKK